MPIAFEYPIPKHWQDFERMLQDLYPEMYMYGSPGQNQDGIDLVSNDQTRVIQAKKRGLGVEPLTVNDLSTWIERGKDFYKHVTFERFIIATTQKTDKHLQIALFEQLELRDDIPFKVEILFWDRIEELFILRPELIRKYYLTELYDPKMIDLLKTGSLDTYIQTTLLSTLVCRDTGKPWPSIDSLVNELPSRIHTGYGHELNLETLKEDYLPFKTWCQRILIDAKGVEKFINQDFDQVELLPIQWASTYISTLRDTDLVAVLETELALLNWIRKMKSLINQIDKLQGPFSDHDFANACDEARGSLKILTDCIADNAEALSAYQSLKLNMDLRGIPEYSDINPISNARLFGYYGYELQSSGTGSSGAHITLYCEPLKQLGLNTWVILEGTQQRHNLRSGKQYRRPLPSHTKIRTWKLSH
ncbi:hypothetical protein ATG66_0105 [Vibrio sp. ES.051]|uniref:hypothetical protein n=1 Tax=Vibrio sp. ES.051 TaxID=1761909 RepID=UPI000BF57405|nr:hypothetical protein [Vibrio sp. ES.051]PFG58796.1 hypothetical protein ATG66_0105 [Vibrio sp. ES.051]